MRVETFRYFAYGSNMLTERLRKRCPSASPLGIAKAQGFRIAFCKRSKDGSGKATLIKVPEGEVYGVSFETERSDLEEFDQHEGKSHEYDRCEGFVTFCMDEKRLLPATAYLATPDSCDDALSPYDWYHALVLAGAIQHNLPRRYVEALRRVGVQRDADSHREQRLQALELLECAGFGGMMNTSSS